MAFLELRQIPRHHLGRRRVVRAVDQNQRGAFQHFQSPLPPHGAEPIAHGRVAHRESLSGGRLNQSQGASRIVPLVHAGQREGEAGDGPPGSRIDPVRRVKARHAKFTPEPQAWGLPLGCHPIHNGLGLDIQPASDDRSPIFDDPGLLARNGGDGRPQLILMIERHGDNGGGERPQDIGRVESPAHSHFDDRHVDLRLRKGAEGHGRVELEKGRRQIGARSRADRSDQLHHGLFFADLPRDANALAVVD